jgi:hypothetical protein
MVTNSSYDRLSWVDALASRDKPRDDRDLANANEADVANEGTLERTASLAFGTRIEETKNEALSRSSRQIFDDQVESAKLAKVTAIKKKLEENEIDPVALKIATKEEWDSVTDAGVAMDIATAAATEYERRLKHEFEQNAFKKQEVLSSRFQPEFKSGRIMSATSGNEESGIRGHIPANASSIFEPDRIDKFAEAENQHDMFVASLKKHLSDKVESRKKDLAPNLEGAPEPMNGGKIFASKSDVPEVGGGMRVASNQISMHDVNGLEHLSQEDMKQQLEQMFMSRLPDAGEQIKVAAKERLDEIRPDREKARKEDRNSWEKVEKAKSTGELQQRLTNLWLQE